MMKVVYLLSICLFVLSLFTSSVNGSGGYGPEPVYQQSGYITVPGFNNDNGTHLFYWLFNARAPTSNTPFVIWLTGGPGCSSMIALLYENGPYMVQPDLSLKRNPFSWNTNAHLMFIDQPVGTGFSYADSNSDYVTNETQVAEDLYQFLQIFFEQNPSYNRNFHIFGESYAGHYIPAIAHKIVAENNQLSPGEVRIDLQSIGIGNGWVNPKIQYSAYADLLYSAGLLDGVSTNAYNWVQYPACEAAIDASYEAGLVECSVGMEGVLADAELQNFRTINVYDVTQRCEVEPLCYDFSLGTQWISQPSVGKALGVNPAIGFTDCDAQVHTDLTGDWVPSMAEKLANVLQSNVRVLVYSGTNDFVCNWIGGERWTHALDWAGADAFRNAQYRPWIEGGAKVGQWKGAKGLVFLQVYNAGHMVPMNQPRYSLNMFNRFINGTGFH